MPTRTQACLSIRRVLLLAVLPVAACSAAAQAFVQPPPATPPAVEPPNADVRGYTPISFDVDAAAVRGLRAIETGVELFDRASGQALRRFEPGRTATCWAHLSGDRWYVAFEGGEVLEVDFESQRTREGAQFDGDVLWFSIKMVGLQPTIHSAIAEHTVEGVGRLTLLYTTDAETYGCSAVSLGDDLSSVYPDEHGRVWLLPEPGSRVRRLRYVAAASGALASVEVPRLGEQVGRNFGGVVTIPDGPVLVWGPPESGFGPAIGWAAELVPPMFDDGAWQEVETFDNRQLPFAATGENEMRFKLRRGQVTLAYDTELELLVLSENGREEGWVAQPTMEAWVREREWYLFFLFDPAESIIEITPGSRDVQRFDPDPSLPDGWADAHMHRLLGEPKLRAGRLDPERRTDALLEASLSIDVRIGGHGFDREFHVSAGCDSAWVLGLTNGIIVAYDRMGGKFKPIAEVFGIPIDIKMREREGRRQMWVDYWPILGQDDSLHRAVFAYRRAPGGEAWHEISDAPTVDRRPHIWTDRRVAELWPLPGRGGSVQWQDLATRERLRTIERADGLDLAGLLEMPDGRVVGYGTDRQRGNDAPVLVDVVRGRKGILWHRDFGFYAHNAAMPTQSITHAVYIPETRRVLMIAGDTVWSTNRWFSDWREEGPIVRADEDEAGVDEQ
ncbi:hypothetical protein OT109_09050 [Phycisphaeraceae bacterium D3-23]